MRYKKHYLSEVGNEKYCPLQNGMMCNSHCAWFDHEAEDCRMIGGFWKVTEAINYLADNGIEVNIKEFRTKVTDY